MAECRSDDACEYFSYNSDRDICLLFDSCVNFDDSDPTFVTGQGVCVYPDPSM